MIWIINSRSIISGRCAGTGHNAAEGFHCQRNGAVPILSLHTLCSKFPKSTCGNGTTTAQRPKFIPPQQIIQVWLCTIRPGTDASQPVEWRPEYSRTQGQKWSERSPTPKEHFRGSEKVHGGNGIHEESLANNIRWQVLDGWRSLETSDWSPGSSAGISRCTCRNTICVSIARWSIAQNRSANTRRCKSSILFIAPLSDLRILTTPEDIHSWNWRLVPFKDGWLMGHIELLSEVSGWMCVLGLNFGSWLRSSCLMMLTSPRSLMIRCHGSREWKCLISFTTSFSSPPTAWGTSQQHRSISNLLLLRL